MIKLSVIIPAYNAHKTIENVLDIVTKWEDTEIIISDDASDIPYDYLKDKYDIKIIRQDINSGAGVARNKGLSIATGEWITFIDADDIPDDILYNSILSEDITDKINMIFVGLEYINNNNEAFNYTNLDLSREIIHGKIYRRSFLQNNHLQFHRKLRLYEDIVFQNIVNDFLHDDEIIKVEDIGYHWNYYEESTTQKLANEDNHWTNSEIAILERCRAQCILINNSKDPNMTSCNYDRDFILNSEKKNESISELNRSYHYNKQINPSKKISFIIPLYNSHRFIKDTLNDLYKKLEEYKGQFEVILTDDASDNNDYDYLNDYDDLKIIYNITRRYMGGNRNRALRIADGEFVYFLDHDDRIYKEGIDYFMSLNKDDFNAIYLGQRNFENNKESGNYFANICCHAKFFRTNYLRQENILFDERIKTSEDVYLVHTVERRLQYQGKDNTIHRNISIPMNLWMYHQDSTFSRKRNNREYIEEFFVDAIRASIYSMYDKNNRLMKESASTKDYLDKQFKEKFAILINFKHQSKNFKKSNIKAMIAYDCFIYDEFGTDIQFADNLNDIEFINFIKTAKQKMSKEQRKKLIHELLFPC